MSDVLTLHACASLVKSNVKPEVGGQRKYIGLEHIEQGTLRLSGTGLESDVASTKAAFNKGDVLFGKLRPYFRKVVYAPFAGVCSTDIWVLRAKPGIDQRFLYYWVASQEFVDYAVQGSDGTRMPRASWSQASQHSIPFQTEHEQKAIAHILGTLDDKIDQLRKTNSVLEDMASALFKSWFVDFDPVKAKQENRPTGLPKDLDDLFPDSVEDSVLGPIPTGWRVAGLASTGEFLNGLALQKYPGDVLPVIKIPQLRQNSTEGADKCSDGVAPQYVIDDGDLLFSWSGTLVAGWWTAGKGALNQHLFKVSSGELSLVMLKHWIDHHLPWFRLVASSKAVTMGHIKRSHLDEAKVVIPAMALNDHAQTILADYRDKFIANGKHIRTLTNLRDTLLPKLISGDLRVPEAEQMVAELGL